MKDLVAELRASIAATLLLAVLCCGIYPVVVWAVGQGLFSDKANGSLVRVDGKVAGSSLLAQGFTAPNYFHPRPSAAGQGYDAASSGGHEPGAHVEKADRGREATGRGLPDGKRPAPGCPGAGRRRDVVGERPGPPHQRPERRSLQAARVAAARGMTKEDVRKKVRAHTEGRTLGIFGEPRVNVLMLNLDLDGKM